MIWETIVTTRSPLGRVHIAPMGIRMPEPGVVLLAPFRPSTTLDNLLASRCAVVNLTDDVRVFAGCLTGRHDWPIAACTHVPGVRLAGCLAHRELRVSSVEDDPQRPVVLCDVVHEQTHAPFRGFNRAQSAVVEAAILVSRLDMLPPEKIDAEVRYLAIAIEKTAGEAEREAWGWLMDRIAVHRAKPADPA
jgi:hypothetical protein